MKDCNISSTTLVLSLNVNEDRNEKGLCLLQDSSEDLKRSGICSYVLLETASFKDSSSGCWGIPVYKEENLKKGCLRC